MASRHPKPFVSTGGEHWLFMGGAAHQLKPDGKQDFLPALCRFQGRSPSRSSKHIHQFLQSGTEFHQLAG